MKHVHDVIRDRIYSNLGLTGTKTTLTPEQIKRQECPPEFTNLMDNRFVMGFFRYGSIRQSKSDNVSEIEKRRQKYIETGNTEYLVDIANFARAEFINPKHHNAHFNSIDDGQHAD